MEITAVDDTSDKRNKKNVEMVFMQKLSDEWRVRENIEVRANVLHFIVAEFVVAVVIVSEQNEQWAMPHWHENCN